MLQFLENIDKEVFLFLNGMHSDFFDTIFYCVSDKYIWIPLYLFLLFLLIRKYRTKSIIPILSVISVIVLTDQLSVHLFKNVFLRYRPSHNLELQNIVHIVNDYHGGKYGFVSSHAANTFGLATIFSFWMTNRNISVLIFIWAVFVSYSRIYLGVHYPSDIVGGALLGLIIGILVYIIIRFFNKKFGFQ